MSIDCCKSYVGKQIIGLLTSTGPECLFYYAPNINMDGSTIDGIDMYDNVGINIALSPYGYSYNFYDSTDLSCCTFALTYVGTEPPTYLPSIADINNNPIIYTLSNCCTKVCVKATVNSDEYLNFQTGYGWISYNVNNITGFDDFANMEIFIKNFYGPQTTYSFTDNGNGTFDITIDNAFICSPVAWSADNVTYTDMVDCATPPAPLCYYSLTILSAPDSDFTNWTIDGQPFLTNVGNLTGNYSSQANSFNPSYFDERYIWIIDEFANLPAIPDYRDSFNNQWIVSWEQGACELTCFDYIVPKTDLLFNYISTSLTSYQTGSGLDTIAVFGYLLNVSNPTHIANLETYYRTVFGNQVTVTSTLDSNGDYIVRINNTYSTVIYWTSPTIGGIFFTQVRC